MSEMRAHVIHHGLLSVVCRKLVFIRHELVARPLAPIIVIGSASIGHRTPICWDSSIYLHGSGLAVCLGAATASFAWLLMQRAAERVLIVGPFLFEQRF